MNVAKLNEAIKDLENDIKIAHDNETIVDVLCGILSCQVGEITDSVRELVKLAPDANMAECEANRESIMRDAVLMAVSESIVKSRHVLYESEPSMCSDCYGDEMTITLNAEETSIQDHLDNAKTDWEDFVDAVQDERRAKEQEAKEKAEAKAKMVADAENNNPQQSNCSEGV
tara:strand:- start:5647 stop:6162 length:516 start_codon:yes stop_codon:yes gene_type:complete